MSTIKDEVNYAPADMESLVEEFGVKEDKSESFMIPGPKRLTPEEFRKEFYGIFNIKPDVPETEVLEVLRGMVDTATDATNNLMTVSRIAANADPDSMQAIYESAYYGKFLTIRRAWGAIRETLKPEATPSE